MKLWWYLARASGIVAWTLLGSSALVGVALSGRLVRRPRPAWLLDLHRFLAGLGVAFVAVHLVSIVIDSFVPFGWADVLVPLASKWRPGAVAWGIAALYLLVGVEATSLAMHRLPRRAWYVVHLTSYALFACATVHGLLAGTDTANPVVRWGGAGGLAVVVFVLVLRLPAGVPDPSRAPPVEPAS